MNIGRINKFYFYAYTGRKCGSIIIRYTLSKIIDSDKLAHAVNLTLRGYPFLRLTPAVSRDGDITFSENRERCTVYPLDNNRRRLGTADTNGYMFAVRAADNIIEITAFHGFGDVRAINSFTAAVLLRYLSLVDETLVKVDAIDEPQESAEKTLYEKCLPFRGRLSANRYKKKNVFVIPTDTPLTGTPEFHVFRVKYPLDQFLSKVKDMNGSPTSFLSTLIAESISSIYDISDDIVTASVPVDMRRILDSNAQSNFTVNADLPFFNEETCLKFEQRVMRQKQFLAEQISRDNLISAVISYGDLIEDVMKAPLSDKETVEMLQRKTIEAARNQKTYLLTNVGPLKFPEYAMKHIINADVTLPLIEDSPIACVTAFGNTGCINRIQNNDESLLINTIKDTFVKLGIDAQLIDEGRTASDTVEPYLYVK